MGLSVKYRALGVPKRDPVIFARLFVEVPLFRVDCRTTVSRRKRGKRRASCPARHHHANDEQHREDQRHRQLVAALPYGAKQSWRQANARERAQDYPSASRPKVLLETG